MADTGTLADTEILADTETLAPESRRELLDLARRAISEFRERGAIPDIPVNEDTLGHNAAAFVSLHQEGRLRGCIGTFDDSQPLFRNVIEMAVAAANEDTRFEPLGPGELRHTALEISVLGPMLPARPTDVVVGTHGLYVVRGRNRGVLLPQVAVQYGWDAPTFLAQACVKAGLPEHAWEQPGTSIQTFTAEVFGDHDTP